MLALFLFTPNSFSLLKRMLKINAALHIDFKYFRDIVAFDYVLSR